MGKLCIVSRSRPAGTRHLGSAHRSWRLDAQELRRVLKRQTGPVTVVVPTGRIVAGHLIVGRERRSVMLGADGPDDVTAAVGVGLSPWLASDRRMLWIGGRRPHVGGIGRLGNIAEVSGAAVLTTIQAKDLFPDDHPQFVGCTLQSAVSRSIAALRPASAWRSDLG